MVLKNTRGRIDTERIGKMTREEIEIDAAEERTRLGVRDKNPKYVRRVLEPDLVDIKELRKKLGLSQKEFAEKFHFNQRTLQEWEQHRAQPPASAQFLLQAIRRAPNLIEKTLKAVTGETS